MASSQANPLLSTQKSDSNFHVVLHPLVILNISDYITRHTLRGLKTPIVGAIIGQQNGREVTMEHVFDCHVVPASGGWQLELQWFTQRLEEMKLVHKDRSLDLVGWYKMLPTSGPTPDILGIHNQILAINESAILLAFHPEEVETVSGGKLPLATYETVFESDEARRDGGAAATGSSSAEGEDKEMKDGNETLKLRFRELPYSVETGEAEMISMDFVARGGANAASSVPDPQQQQPARSVAEPVKTDFKGKRRAVSKQAGQSAASAPVALSREDEDLVSTLTAKANAIRMLHSRIQLLIKYLEGLPPSYLSSSSAEAAAATSAGDAVAGEKGTAAEDIRPPGVHPTTPSLPLLRSIQALVNRIPLLISGSVEDFNEEMLRESNDVHLITLLTDVLQSANDLRDLGKKFFIIDQAKAKKAADLPPLGTGIGQAGFNLGVGDLIV